MVLALGTVMILAGYVLPQFQAAVRGARRRAAAAHPDDAVRRPFLRRPVVGDRDLVPVFLPRRSHS
ncbi:MAG: hypothetical protein R2705_24885 [Ilumatobacteraceae bacterium]